MISFERLLEADSYSALLNKTELAKSQEALIDENRLQEGYALAYTLYSQKHYQEALHYFRILVLIRPSEAKYWRGLGSTLQMLKMYEEALNCYSGAQILALEEIDPLIYVYAADCFFALNRIKAGLDSLLIAKKQAKITQDKSILKHIAFMQEAWGTEKEKV